MCVEGECVRTYLSRWCRTLTEMDTIQPFRVDLRHATMDAVITIYKIEYSGPLAVDWQHTFVFTRILI